jgi:FkbM family methyltransferase
MASRLADSALRSLTVRRLYEEPGGIPVVGVAIRNGVRHLLPKDHKRWITVPTGLAEGLEMLVDPRYELDYLRGDHEPWVQEFLRESLSAGNAFYDVGAHVGFFTLCASRIVGQEGMVYAFEPDEDNYDRLRANVSRNRLKNVNVIRAAVWSNNTRLLFQSAWRESSRMGGMVTTAERAQNSYTNTIDAVALDNCFNERPRVIKVDVEGSELPVLMGAGTFLRRSKTTWKVEVHAANLGEFAAGILQEHGYKVSLLGANDPLYQSCRQQYLTGIDSGGHPTSLPQATYRDGQQVNGDGAAGGRSG